MMAFVTGHVLGFLASWGWILAGLAIVVCAVVWPAAVWKFKWQILLAAAIAVATMFGMDAAHLRATIAARDLADAQAGERAQKAARDHERIDAAALADVAAAYERGKEDGKAEVTAVRADRDRGALVLHDKFKCPAARVLPDAATSAGVGDGEAAAIFSAADQDVLVQIGADADEVARQLEACQATVMTYVGRP